MTSARIALLVLFTVIMAWLWSPYFMNPSSTENATSDVIAKPDYIANKLKQTIYNEIGTRSHTVTADKMELYQELGFSHFEAPIFTLYNGPKNWQITAEEATLYENKILILEGNVIAQNLTDKAMITHINADHIRVEIDKRIMQSEQPVEVVGPGLLITGRGLNADLNTDVIELINHTRTIYHDQ